MIGKIIGTIILILVGYTIWMANGQTVDGVFTFIEAFLDKGSQIVMQIWEYIDQRWVSNAPTE